MLSVFRGKQILLGPPGRWLQHRLYFLLYNVFGRTSPRHGMSGRSCPWRSLQHVPGEGLRERMRWHADDDHSCSHYHWANTTSRNSSAGRWAPVLLWGWGICQDARMRLSRWCFSFKDERPHSFGFSGMTWITNCRTRFNVIISLFMNPRRCRTVVHWAIWYGVVGDFTSAFSPMFRWVLMISFAVLQRYDFSWALPLSSNRLLRLGMFAAIFGMRRWTPHVLQLPLWLHTTRRKTDLCAKGIWCIWCSCRLFFHGNRGDEFFTNMFVSLIDRVLGCGSIACNYLGNNS